MSVGSIADTVFEFKGFIINGINLYRDITEPIREFFKTYFGFNISQGMQDFIVITSFYITTQRKAIKYFNRQKIPTPLKLFLVWLATLILFMICLVIG